MTTWSDAGVRATGLATRLVRRADLTMFASLDRTALIAALSGHGHLGPTPERPSAADLELGLRRRAAEWLALLMKWCGERTQALAGLFEDDDRRAVRRMLRGAAQGVPAAARLAGLIPTAALPARALALLSEAPRPRDVASRLISLESPYGPPLFPEVERKDPDLFTLELALDCTWIDRAARSAQRADRHLREHLRASIDLSNAEAALALRRDREDKEVGEKAFLEGGARVDRAAFHDTINAASDEDATSILDERLLGAPRSLGDLIRFERACSHRDPSTTAPIILYVLSLRAHLRDLARIVWAGALGAPASLLEGGWVTP